MRLAFASPTAVLLRGEWRQGLSRVHRPPATGRVSRASIRASSTTVDSSRPISAAAAGAPIQSRAGNPPAGAPTFQDAVRLLQDYWAAHGCVIWQACNTEVGAGTMNPATFLRVLGPEPWSVAYEEPSLRPDDSRFGENPNRLQRHTQFQVIVKPAPACAQELVLGSYRALGIDVCKHDVRFVEDNWASPALGAWGLGWEVWLDGMEVTQFTYFQQAGGVPLDAVSVEVTYGLERIVMALQGKTHFKDIVFAPGVTYGDIFLQGEYEMSVYNLNDADVARNARLFDEYEAEALQLLEKRLPFAAYSFLLKASHTFNVLDARGAVGVTERARFFQRMRALSRDVATLWIERRAELEFPLMNEGAPSSPTNVAASPSSLKAQPTNATLPPTERFLLEIGMEELPPGELDNMMAQVQTLFGKLLDEKSLAFDDIQVTGTPRRVAVAVHGLQTRQKDTEESIRGPPLRIALGEDGAPTKAAIGFLKKQGFTDSSSAPAKYDEESGYMYATVKRTGRSAVDVLAEAIPSDVLSKISFGKTMRWNDTGVAFSRPVRWLLCILGEHVVPFNFAGVTSGSVSRSLRGADGFASSVVVKSADAYDAEMQKAHIVLSKEQRREMICTEASKLVSSIGGSLVLDAGLLEEVANLVENPIPILGTFDASFLSLPDEVLITVMKKHQRYFPVRIGEEKCSPLLNYFVTVVNGNSNLVDLDAIRAGNEAVLRARYADASFFYENDTKGKKLSDFIPLLDKLTFQESLGSMLDKTKRIQEIVPALAPHLALSAADQSVAASAASLSKADLATSMVVEMTSLAGVMGRHYAEKSGEVPPAVSDAIFEAALPRFSGDALAQSLPGAAVAVADRLDSLLTLFSVGLAPRATADPFALRRAALGVVQTLIALAIDADVAQLAEQADVSGKSSPENRLAVTQFIEKRLETFLTDAERLRPDVVKATLAVGGNARNPARAHSAACALQRALENNPDTVRDAADANGRAARLLKSLGAGGAKLAGVAVDPALFEAAEEKALLDGVARVAAAADAPDTGLEERLRLVAGLKGTVDAFFDGVLVNAEDENVRRNRQALSAQVVRLTSECANLELLQL